MPRTWPPSLIRYASAARSNGKVCTLITSLFCCSSSATSARASCGWLSPPPPVTCAPDSPAEKLAMRQHLRRLGDQADQLLDRRLAGDVEDLVDLAAGGLAHPVGHAVAVQHGGGADLAQVVLVALARRRDHPEPPGERHLDGDRADAARAAVDEHRLARLRAQQAEGPLEVSPATPAAAATAQSTDDGFFAQAFSTAYSACVFRPRPKTSSPTETPVTPSPTSSTTPAAS